MTKFIVALLLAAVTAAAAPIRIFSTANSLNTGAVATNRVSRGLYTNATTTAWADVSQFSNVGIQFVLQSTDGSTSNTVWQLWKSLDRNHTEVAPFQQFVVPLTSTNSSVYITNFAVVGIPYIALLQFTNGSAAGSYLTNSSVLLFPKN